MAADLDRNWTPGAPVELQTGHYLLRSLEPEDISQRYVNWLRDPVVNAGVHTPLSRLTVETARERIKRRYDNATKFEWGIFDLNRARLLIGFVNLALSVQTRVVLMNTVIGDRDYWGEKVLLQVSGKAMEFIFEVLNAEKIRGEAMARNLPTVYINKAMGLRVEAILRKEWRMADGSRTDVLSFGLLREDWQARRKEEAPG